MYLTTWEQQCKEETDNERMRNKLRQDYVHKKTKPMKCSWCHQLCTSCTAIHHCYYVIHVITACEDHHHLQCHQHTWRSLTRKTRASVTLLYLVTRSSKFCFSCCSDSAFPVMMKCFMTDTTLKTKCSWRAQLCTSRFMTDTTLIITQRRVDTTNTNTSMSRPSSW